MIYFVIFSSLFSASIVLFSLAKTYRQEKISVLGVKNRAKLIFTGFLANLADTLGIGSFAVVVSLDKFWGLLDDKKLPGTMNAHAVFPAVLQSALFLKFIPIDPLMLFLFVLAGSIGGFTGGYVVSGWNRQHLRLGMALGFFAIGILIFANQLGYLPLAGEAVTLSGFKLVAGFFALMVIGMLSALGIGFYAPTQTVLFLLGLSPLVAFPIMTTVGVIVQSTTALPFLKKGEVALAETLLLIASGLVGVLVAFPILTYVDPHTIRWLLFAVVAYNTYTMYRSWRSHLVKAPLPDLSTS